MQTQSDVTPPPPEGPTLCAECRTSLFEGQDRQPTDDGTFCRPCFERLTHEVKQALASQEHDIDYPMAMVGGVGGAAVGVVAWWGFTVLTNISFGLVAVVIGFATGKGVSKFTGGKRHLNLQIISALIAIAGFAYASYLVNRSFFHAALAEQGQGLLLPWLPSPSLLYAVVSAGFGVMDIVFLAILTWEAWKIPAPLLTTGGA